MLVGVGVCKDQRGNLNYTARIKMVVTEPGAYQPLYSNRYEGPTGKTTVADKASTGVTTVAGKTD